MDKQFNAMVRQYLNVGHEILYLTRDEVKDLNISKEVLFEQVKKALSMYSMGETLMPAKTNVFPDSSAVYISMPALIPQMSAAGIKWVGAFNNNMRDYNLPSLCAMLMLNDYETGWPIAVMDGIHIMETRTPAIAMVAAQYMARKDSEVFGIIGLGREGSNHLDVVKYGMPNLKKVLVWDVSEAAMDRAVEKYAEVLAPVPIEKAESLEAIVRNSDVLASCTFFTNNPPEPPIKKEWVKKGQTIIVTDLHTQFSPDIINAADMYIVDSRAQQEHLVEDGYFYGPIQKPTCELGEIIAGKYPARTSDDQLIVVNPSGMAVDDFAVTPIVIEQALKNGIGRILPL